MITKERSQALLAVLEKRKPTPEILERIDRVKSELGMIEEPKPKKKKVLKEVEVDV